MASIDDHRAHRDRLKRALRAVVESHALIAHTDRLLAWPFCTAGFRKPSEDDIAHSRTCAAIDGSIFRLLDRNVP